jgi:hypothetical protein
MAISYAVIVQSRKVGGSKTDDISKYGVRTDFPINAVLKWVGWFQTIYFNQEVVILMKIVQEIWNDKEITL